MTQVGCYELVLDRKLGKYQLPVGWVVIAAGNPATERGVHFSMPRPLRNRFVHFDLESDFDDWTKWAVKAGIHPEILAFLRFRPTLLHDAGFHPRSECVAHAALLADGLAGAEGPARRLGSAGLAAGTEAEAALLEGTIGLAPTTEFVVSCGSSGSSLRCQKSC